MIEKSDQKGFSTLALLLALLVLVIVGAGAYYYQTQKTSSSTLKGNSVISSPTPSPAPSKIASPSATPNTETANWKTYTTSYYHITFKYPSDWTLESTPHDSFDSITLYKKDLDNKGEYQVALEVGNNLDNGAGGASSTFVKYNQFKIEEKTAYILQDEASEPGMYTLSSCPGPQKCLFGVPNSTATIDFYTDHHNNGDQAVKPIPANDPRTPIAIEILKTISF